MHNVGENSSPAHERSMKGRTFIAALILVAIAWAIYRPDRSRPLHILDFSEFIPVLQGSTGFADSVAHIVKYYASQGRFNVIPYLMLVAKWEMFEWWSPGWQVGRAVMMIAVFALGFVLLRRLGACRPGALIGASVYLWAPSAGEGWVRMTVAEPLGAALVLGASIRAVQFQTTNGWTREVIFIALAAIGIIWTKELMAPLILLPVGLALTTQSDGFFSAPRPTRRNVTLVVAVIIASVLAIIPVAAIYVSGGDSAYASMYGRGLQSVFVLHWILALIPFDVIVFPANLPWAVAFLAFIILVAVGWRVGWSEPTQRERARWLLAFALIVPLAGVLAYLPNPWYATFYTLPYLVGPALLVGMAATWLLGNGRVSRALVFVAWSAIVVHSIARVSTHVVRTDAVQRRDAHVISFVADSVEALAVQFASKTRPPYDWLGLGAAMSRMSAARGSAWPATRNVNCDEARSALVRSDAIVTVNLESSCAFKGPDIKVITKRFRRLDARAFRVVEDSVHADILLPKPER